MKRLIAIIVSGIVLLSGAVTGFIVYSAKRKNHA